MVKFRPLIIKNHPIKIHNGQKIAPNDRLKNRTIQKFSVYPRNPYIRFSINQTINIPHPIQTDNININENSPHINLMITIPSIKFNLYLLCFDQI